MLIKYSPPLPRRDKKCNFRILTKSPSLEEVLEDICRCFNQDIEKIKSKSRSIKLVTVRRIYCYVAHVLTNETCCDTSHLINRDYTTCLDRVRQCFTWFEINEASFLEEWNVYVLKSTIWKEYYLLKKQAIEEENYEYLEQFKQESGYWKRQVRKAKANKRRWKAILESVMRDNDIDKINEAKENFKKYAIRLGFTKKSLLSIITNTQKTA